MKYEDFHRSRHGDPLQLEWIQQECKKGRKPWEMWKASPRGDWMIWLACELKGPSCQTILIEAIDQMRHEGCKEKCQQEMVTAWNNGDYAKACAKVIEWFVNDWELTHHGHYRVVRVDAHKTLAKIARKFFDKRSFTTSLGKHIEYEGQKGPSAKTAETRSLSDNSTGSDGTTNSRRRRGKRGMAQTKTE